MRSANVTVRPAVRRYDIPLAVTPNPEAHVIPWQELVAGVADDRFYLRWPACGKRVIVTSGHMLNIHHAPAVGRFMVDLSHDATPIMSTFERGPAESFPTCRAFSMAEWSSGRRSGLSAPTTLPPVPTTITFLDAWRADWDVPRYVCLSVGYALFYLYFR